MESFIKIPGYTDNRQTDSRTYDLETQCLCCLLLAAEAQKWTWAHNSSQLPN